MTEDMDDRYAIKVDGLRGLMRHACDAAKLDEFREAV
jgi:hypothetical protein